MNRVGSRFFEHGYNGLDGSEKHRYRDEGDQGDACCSDPLHHLHPYLNFRVFFRVVWVFSGSSSCGFVLVRGSSSSARKNWNTKSHEEDTKEKGGEQIPTPNPKSKIQNGLGGATCPD